MFQVLPTQLKGNPVKVRDGPAAVTGDERHTQPLMRHTREGVAGKKIRKSEDLPEQLIVC